MATPSKVQKMEDVMIEKEKENEPRVSYEIATELLLTPEEMDAEIENFIVIENDNQNDSEVRYEIPTQLLLTPEKMDNVIVIENEKENRSEVSYEIPTQQLLTPEIMENVIVIENEKENDSEVSYEIPTQLLLPPVTLVKNEDSVENRVGSSVLLDTLADDNQSTQQGISDSGYSGSSKSKVSRAAVNMPLRSKENITVVSSNTVPSSSSPLDPKLSPGLAKAIHEKTLKFPEGRPEPTFYHCVIDGCGYRSYGDIAQKYHAKEVHNLAKPQYVEKLLNDI